MKRLFLLLALLPLFAGCTHAQTFGGTAGSSVFVPSPFKLCFGSSNTGDPCLYKYASNELAVAGTLVDTNGNPIANGGFTGFPIGIKTSAYLITASDFGLFTHFVANSASPMTLTLPASAPTAAQHIWIENAGAGIVTVSNNGLNIDTQAVTITLNQNQGVMIGSDGTGYYTERGIGGGFGTVSANNTGNVNPCAQYANNGGSTTVQPAANPCGSGSGTVSGQANGVIPLGTAATTITAQSHLDDGNTTASTIHSSENVESTGTITSGVGGSTAGLDAVGGNTSNPALPSNAVGFLGPSSASFTSYFGQFPSTPPSSQLLLWAAPSVNVSALTWVNSSTTPNGQTCALGSTCNVNSGAAAHSMALNEGAGAAIAALALAADQIPVGRTSADPAATTVPDCQDSGGNHLNYTQSTHAISCGTSGGGSFDPLDVTTTYLRDDFIGESVASNAITHGDFGWQAYGLTGTATAVRQVSAFPHLGILRIEGDNTTTGHGTGIAWGDAANTGDGVANNLSLRTFDSIYIVRPANITNAQYDFGFVAALNTFGGDGCYVKFDTTNSDTHWIARCQQGGTATNTDLGVAPSTSLWSKVRVYSTVAGTVNFAVCNGDGCALPTSSTGFAAISTNVSTGQVSFGAIAVNANSAQAVIDLDLVAFKLTSTGR